VTDTVRSRLMGTFALVIVLLGVGGVGGTVAVVAATSSVTTTTTRVVRLTEANAGLLQSLTDAQTGIRGYLLLHEERYLAPFEHGRVAYREHIGTLRRLTNGRPLAVKVDREAELAEDWMASAVGTVSRIRGGGTVDLSSPTKGKTLFEQFRDANSEVADAAAAERAAAQHRSEMVRRISIAAVAAATSTGLVIGSVAAVRTTRRLRRPLEGLERTLVRLTEGDHSARAEVTGPREVARVAESVNTLADEGDRLRLMEAERQRLERLAGTLGRRVREHLDPHAVLQQGMASLGEELNVDVLHAWLRRDDRLVPAPPGWARSSSEAGTEKLPRPSREVVQWAGDLYRSGQMHIVADTSDHLGIGVSWVDDLADAANAGSLVVAPAGVGPDLLGMVVLVQYRSRVWSSSSTRLIDSVVSDIARGLQQSQLYAQQQELVDQLRGLDATRSAFLSTVSHELRTPLTSIAGYAELLCDGDSGPVNDSQMKMLEVISRNTTRLKLLIEDLLVLSRIESGALQIEPIPIDLRDLVTEAVGVIPTADKGGLTLTSRIDDSPLIVNGDVDQLERVLLNLLSNAVKFTKAGGKVTVTAFRDGGDAIVSIADTGIGIPAEDKAKLFTRFFRASNALSGAIQGTGLGLTIVRSIVEQHGGSTAVESEVGKGTTVVVRVPLLTVPAASAAVPAAGGRANGPSRATQQELQQEPQQELTKSAHR
jgi:two-component system phosphate regulon sensor histidine kinase PhoR